MRRNMKAERARNGMTIDQVAERIGVSRNAVSRWENDISSPSTNNLMALCQLYGVSPEYLLDKTDERHGALVSA